MNDYYTHRPYLIETLNGLDFSKNINILEFGTGEGSGEILFEFASRHSNINIQAFDNNMDWLSSMKQKYGLPNYRFMFVESWSNLLNSYEFAPQYDLIFVDQSPWEARTMSLDYLKGRYQKAILHDYDFYNKGITPPEDIYNTDSTTFFARYLDTYKLQGYSTTLPPTLVFTKL